MHDLMMAGDGDGVVTGHAVFTTPGTTTWTCPEGVTSISVLMVGGACQGGGALFYKNDIKVTPGGIYNVVVGAPGSKGQPFPTSNGGASYFHSTSAWGVANGSTGVTGGTYSPGNTTGVAPYGTSWGGGNGGSTTGAGGGGAGGYGGKGGDGSSENSNSEDGVGGGGGGGGSFQTNYDYQDEEGNIWGSVAAGGGGGGVGIYGQGANGSGVGGSQGGGGYGGSGGGGGVSVGPNSGQTGGNGGAYGGGAGRGAYHEYFGGNVFCGSPGGGVVRLVWPGTTRQFPSTNVSSATN